MFSKQHYIAIANLIGKAITNEETFGDLISDFSLMFKDDNCLFDNQRFKNAITESIEKQKQKQKEILNNIMFNIAQRGLNHA